MAGCHPIPFTPPIEDDMTSNGPNSDEITTWLQARMAETLECDAGDVDVDAQFDQLGLDSLAVLIATGELAEWLDTELEAATLYEFPSIRKLSVHLAG